MSAQQSQSPSSPSSPSSSPRASFTLRNEQPQSGSPIPSSGVFRPSPAQWPTSPSAQRSSRAPESGSYSPCGPKIPTTKRDGNPHPGFLAASSGPYTPSTHVWRESSLSTERRRRSQGAPTPQARSLSPAWPVPVPLNPPPAASRGSRAWLPAPTPRPTESSSAATASTERLQPDSGLPSLPTHPWRHFSFDDECPLHASPVLGPERRPSPAPSTTLSAAFHRMALRERQLPSDVRVVALPWGQDATTLEPLELPGGADGEPPVTVLVGRQSASSSRPGFALELSPTHRLRVFFDVATDSALAHNDGTSGLVLVALEAEDDAASEPVRSGGGGCCHLESGGMQPISTGFWRIDPAREGDARSRPASVEFFLRPQGYEIRIARAPVAAGTKRARSGSRGGVPRGQVSQLRPRNQEENPLILAPSTQMTIVSGDQESFTIINNRFILGPTGERAVFEGRHSAYPGPLAVKVIKAAKHSILEVKRLANSWEREAWFLKEANHPSIVQFKGSDPRFFAIFMEYHTAPDLAFVCTGPGHFYPGSQEDAKRVLREMASALAFLAGKNILHNDIKPANILYDRKCGAVLIDFGLATYVGENNLAGGTWPYSPPEAEAKKKPFRGPASEIYSLGIIVLYLMRKMPLPEKMFPRWPMFQGCQEYQAWQARVFEVRDKLHGNLGGIVKRMLQKAPEQRITARQILEKLGDGSV